jgi:DNA invertase Pin-like site-specific DNA recombinase
VAMKNQYTKLIQETYEIVIKLRKKGLSINEIVQKMGIDRQGIVRYWIKLGDKPIRGNKGNATGGNKPEPSFKKNYKF